MFGGDLEALTRRLAHGSEPGARRIGAGANSSARRGAPAGAAPVFLWADRRNRHRHVPAHGAEAAAVRFGRARRAQPRPERRRQCTAAPRLSVVPPAPAADARGPQDSAPIVAAPARTRFTWRTDSDHIFVHIDPALAAALGADAVDWLGRSFLDLAPALDASGDLAAALQSHATWSGLACLAPAGDGLTAPTHFGGAAVFDAAGAFAGYRGFGIVSAERVARAPAHEAEHAPVAEHAPSAEPAPETDPAFDEAWTDPIRGEVSDPDIATQDDASSSVDFAELAAAMEAAGVELEPPVEMLQAQSTSPRRPSSKPFNQKLFNQKPFGPKRRGRRLSRRSSPTRRMRRKLRRCVSRGPSPRR